VDGNLITSPGGLASYEASLYVIEPRSRREQAWRMATALIFGPSDIEAAMTTQERGWGRGRSRASPWRAIVIDGATTH
jgi:transcriptional regulator GlxA family with amidase domain